MEIEKKQSTIEIDNYLTNRKSTEVPAMSARSHGKKNVDNIPISSARSGKNIKKPEEPIK